MYAMALFSFVVLFGTGNMHKSLRHKLVLEIE